MSKPVGIERAAENELRDSITWYEERRAGLGAEFYHEVQRVLQIIERNPQLGGPVPHICFAQKHPPSIATALSLRGYLS